MNSRDRSGSNLELADRPPVGLRSSGRPSHADFRAQRHFGSLDGLRALSILAVVWHHTGAPAFAGGLLNHLGAEGVTLFFAISGFLITTLLLRERDRMGKIDLRAFYVRRTLRIFPLYYAVLLLYLVLVLLLERQSLVGHQFLANLVYFLTYTSNWFVANDGRVIFYFAWSLAAEEQFYLLWPALLKVLRTTARALALMLLATLVLAGIEWGTGSAGSTSGGLSWFVSKLPWAIALGAIVGMALHSEAGFRALAPLLTARGASVVWLLLVGLAAAMPETPRVIWHAALTGFVVSCVVNPRHWLAAPLAWAPIAYLGTISYGMYLLHMLAKNAAVKVFSKVGIDAGWPLLFVSTIVLSVVAASISFRYFESYFLSLKTRFER